MLRTLLESRSRRQSNSFGTAASTAIHLVLITTAAYVTVADARTDDHEEGTPVMIQWPHPPRITPQAAPALRSAVSHSAVGIAKAPSILIDVSAQIPDVSIPLGIVRGDGFTTTREEGNGLASSPAYLGSGPKAGAYDSYEVDIPVTALSGGSPSYPPAMRSAGVEGEVKAEFVVDVKGRADPGSMRIISSTNELFADAVRSALSRMRFAPARLGGKPVPQLVQQLFVFRLSR